MHQGGAVRWRRATSSLLADQLTYKCCGTEAGSYLRLIDSCITQLKAQAPSRTCNESKEEWLTFGLRVWLRGGLEIKAHILMNFWQAGGRVHRGAGDVPPH